MSKHVIWSNDPMPYLEDEPEMSWDEIYDEIDTWLDAERENLDISVPHPILVIADLGLWNGRRSAYRIIGRNVRDIFTVTCGDAVEFWADQYNVHCDDVHHDGVNHYTFRELCGYEEECAPLLDALYYGKPVSSALLNRYSRSLISYVAPVYGWPYVGRKY